MHTKSYTNTRTLIRAQELRLFSNSIYGLSGDFSRLHILSTLLAVVLLVSPFSEYSQSVFTMTYQQTQLAVCDSTMRVLKQCIFLTPMTVCTL